MRVLYGLILCTLLLFFCGMLALRKCVVRQTQQSAAKTLTHRAKRWGIPPQRLLAAADWFLAQKTETMTITSFDDLRLTGRWLPAAQSRGRILLFHGHRSGGLEDFSEALPFYHGLGLDLLLVDQRAHGKSEGKFIGLGVLEKRDCLSWLETVNARFGSDAPTILAGVSMGAATVLLAAGEELPGNVRGVIADCGFTSPRDIVAHQLRRQFHLPPWPLVPITSALCRLLAGYGFDDGSVSAELEKCRLPILFLHGEADDYVPTEMTLRNHAAYGGEKRLYLVPGADHTAAFPQGGEPCRRMIETFINDCLQ